MEELMGKTVKDKVTGYVGTVTSTHNYLTEGKQVGVTAKVGPDGKLPDPKYFTIGRLEIIDNGFDVESLQDPK